MTNEERPTEQQLTFEDVQHLVSGPLDTVSDDTLEAAIAVLDKLQVSYDPVIIQSLVKEKNSRSYAPKVEKLLASIPTKSERYITRELSDLRRGTGRFSQWPEHYQSQILQVLEFTASEMEIDSEQ